MLGAFAELFEEDESKTSGGRAKVEMPPGPRATSGFVGLDNQGATCYLNSLLQALYMTPELRAGLFDLDPHELGIQWVKELEEEKKQAEKDGAVMPDDGIVQNLMGMGFSENGAKRAAVAKKNASFEACMEWALEHAEDPDFNEPLAEKGKKGKKSKKPRLIPLELQRLFTQLQLQNQDAISTEDLTSKGFQWQSYDGRVQQDAHELIRLLIDAVERSLVKTRGQDLVPKLYKGSVVYQTRCLRCRALSEREESFYDILLQVKGSPDIITSLLNYIEPEKLEGSNQYRCDTCEDKVDALRMQQIRVLPPVLIFSLNRFEFDMSTLQRVKVNDRFAFPLSLDMAPFLESEEREHQALNMSEEERVALQENLKQQPKWVPDAWRESTMFVKKLFDEAKDDEEALVQALEQLSTREEALEDGNASLLYDLMAVIIHRGSAYSGHYHALIRDFTEQGQWEAPSDEGGASASNSSSSPSSQEKARKEGKDSPLPMLVKILQEQPVSEVFGIKMIKMGTLGAAVKKACNGQTWNNRYKQKYGSIASYVSSHDDIFLWDSSAQTVCLLQEAATGVFSNDGGNQQLRADEKMARNLQMVEEGGGLMPTGEVVAQAVSVPDVGGEWTTVGAKKSQPKCHSQQEMSDGEAAEVDEADEEGAADIRKKKKERAKAIRLETSKYASRKYGRWFNFDDRRVYPITVRDLEKAFQGKDSGYLLIYRRREDQSTSEAEALKTPPAHWQDFVAAENEKLESARASYDNDCHSLQIVVHFPKEFAYQWPHLLRQEGTSDNQEVMPEIREGISLNVDDRYTVERLKEIILERVQDFSWMIGIPPVLDMITLHELKPHGPGFYLHKNVSEDPLQKLDDVLDDNMHLFAWDGERIDEKEVSISSFVPEAAPITFTITVLGPTSATASASLRPTKVPKVETIFEGQLMHIPRNTNSTQLGQEVVRLIGIAQESLMCHFVLLNSKGDTQVVPAFMGVHSVGVKTISQVKVVDGGELFVEKATGMGTPLARLEAKRRNLLMSIKLENAVTGKGPGTDDGGGLLAGLGLEDDEEVDAMDDDNTVTLKIDQETTLEELKLLGLQKFGLDPIEYLETTRLCKPESKGGAIFEVESLSLVTAGLRNGERLVLESGAPPPVDTFLVKFMPVTGNDPSPKYNADNPGERADALEVEADVSLTVAQLKERMCEKAGLMDTLGSRRLRLTQWTGEAGALVPEILEEGTDAGSPIQLAASGILNCRTGVLLEEGRIPSKGEITLELYLWTPETALEETKQDTNDKIDSALSYESILARRRQHLRPLGSVNTRMDKNLGDLQQLLIEKLKEKEIDMEDSGLDMLIRELRDDMLPGRIIKDGANTGSKPGSMDFAISKKSLKKLRVTGQKPLVLQILDEAAAERFHRPHIISLWVQQWQPSEGKEDAFEPSPEWPPEEILVDGGALPTLGHLNNTLSKRFGIPQEQVLAARHNFGTFTWLNLRPNLSAATKKGKKRGKKAGSNKPKSIKDAPYSVKDGEHLLVANMESQPKGEMVFETSIDKFGKEMATKLREDKRIKKQQKRINQPEVALKLGGDMEFSDDSSDDDTSSEESNG